MEHTAFGVGVGIGVERNISGSTPIPIPTPTLMKAGRNPKPIRWNATIPVRAVRLEAFP